MSLFYLDFLPLLLAVQRSLSEDTGQTEFDSRWITRPPLDNEFPWAVFINMSKADDGTCSGSLIALDWVLTAARCMYKTVKDKRIKVETDESLTIYIGVDKRLDDTTYVQFRKSKKIVYQNDASLSLALVQTQSKFEKRDNPKKPVGFLRLNDLDLEDNVFGAEETVCRSGSYGTIEWDDKRPVELKKLRSLIQRCNCSRSLQQAFPGEATEHWMCGEHKYNMNMCRGDFGASLTCGRQFIGVAVDLVTYREGTCDVVDSVSNKCGEESSVSVFVDVCPYLQWIRDKVPTVEIYTGECADLLDSAVSLRPRHSLLCVTSLYVFWILCRQD